MDHYADLWEAWDGFDNIATAFYDSDERYGDADTAIGDPTRSTTSDIAGIIAAAMRRTRRGQVVQEGVFPVGIQPRQGSQRGRGPGAIRPDVSFIGRDGRRVNLEVDNTTARSRRHVIDHLRAMREAQRAGLQPTAGTRSVFVETTPDGRIRRIRHAAYQVNHRGQVVRDRARSYTRTYRGRGPTLTQALRTGLLDRQPRRQSRLTRRSLRPFDDNAFWAPADDFDWAVAQGVRSAAGR